MTSLRIRPAGAADLDRLAAIEIEAGQIFHSVGMPEVAGDKADRAALRKRQRSGQAWVAEVGGGIAGYILATVADGNTHIDQVSVAPEHARQGIGRRLMRHVEAWGRSHGRVVITLTTFRDVPWNAPYYERLGYRELAASEIGPELEAAMAREATLPGIDPARRCAMRKEVSAEECR